MTNPQSPTVTPSQRALLPCPNPWCEAETREGDYSPVIRLHHYGNYRVICTSCFLEGPLKPTEEEAIAAWNTRDTLATAAQPGAAEMVERCARVAEDYPTSTTKPIGASIAKRIRALSPAPAVAAASEVREALAKRLMHAGLGPWNPDERSIREEWRHNEKWWLRLADAALRPSQPAAEMATVPRDRNAARRILRNKLEAVVGYIGSDVRDIIDSCEIAEEHEPEGMVYAIIEAMIDFASETSVKELAMLSSELEAAKAALRPPLAAAEMVTVPREPTDAMMDAGEAAVLHISTAMTDREASDRPWDMPDYDGGDTAAFVWSAMLAAAPSGEPEQGR